MKRWILHVRSVAKATNPNFAGEVHEAWSGRGGKIIHTSTKEEDAHLSPIHRLGVNFWGYKTKGGATKALREWERRHAEHPEEFWDSTAELIEMEVK